MPGRIRRCAWAAVVVVLWGALDGCSYTTDPAEKPLSGTWIGHIGLLDGSLAWEFRLQEDGLGNVSGTVSHTDLRRIPAPSETITPGVVEGLHASSRIVLTLDYGTSSEVYAGEFRASDRIQGTIQRGTEVIDIAVLELRRIATDPEAAAAR